MSKRSLSRSILPAALVAATLLGGCYYPYGYGGYAYPGYYGYGYPAYVGTGLVVGGWGWGCCGYGWRGGYGWGGWHGGWGGWHGGGWGGWHGSAGFHGGGWGGIHR